MGSDSGGARGCEELASVGHDVGPEKNHAGGGYLGGYSAAAAGAQAKAHGLLALSRLLVARRLGERESDGWRAAIDQGIADLGERLSKMDAEVAQRRANVWRPRLS